ncbi:MAG: Coenzyme F420 hydrogenase/dehydrogenase, beta subunit C-terminal domain [Methanophagales archaeon]|nr:Coenzyme F420 hydrogenase/dehydrogenase, beta subunit C-terminal domain [Methanophagales archaeon]
MKAAELGIGELEGFFKELLTKNVVDCLLLPFRVGKTVTYMLVSDPEKMGSPVIFVPVFGISAANIVKGWTIERKIGVVAKPCEIRAAIELIKLEQISPESVLLFSVDCAGAYNLKDFAEHADEIGDVLDEEKVAALEKKGVSLRTACQICDKRLAEYGDVGIVRVNAEKVMLVALTPKGEEALSAVELTLEEKEVSREDLKRKIKEEAEKRKAEIPRISSAEALDDVLASCILCKNCRDMCPVCYCKVCFFEQPLGNLAGGDMLNLATLRGVLRVPSPVQMFYHLTRLYHVCTTCVACGACEDACPSEIPLTKIYPMVAEKVQEMFAYEPGKSVEEPLPLTTYKEEEYEEYLRP